MIEDLDRFMEEENVEGIIAKGSAFEVPDIYWLTGFRSPDPVTYFKNLGEEAVVASSHQTLERIKKEGNIRETLDITDTYRSMMKEGKHPRDYPELILKEIVGTVFSGKTIGVPEHFPASNLVALQSLGYVIKPIPRLITQARATKSIKELSAIRKAGEATMGAISEVIEMIKDSEVKDKKTLFYENQPLTVRRIKLALEHFLLDKGAESAEDAIVAVGKKGFDWHYLGHPDDELKEGVPIIMDVFPRLKREFYVADVTRTVVKGQPESQVKDMFSAVKAASDAVLDALEDGVTIDSVNLACFKTLEKHGYKSSRLHPGTDEGMTHGLGHGIGLAVHEEPSLYDREKHFEENHVVAIEPGVYLKSFGGVRLENDYVVRKGKTERLTLGLDDVAFL